MGQVRKGMKESNTGYVMELVSTMGNGSLCELSRICQDRLSAEWEIGLLLHCLLYPHELRTVPLLFWAVPAQGLSS